MGFTQDYQLLEERKRKETWTQAFLYIPLHSFLHHVKRDDIHYKTFTSPRMEGNSHLFRARKNSEAPAHTVGDCSG